MIRVLIVAIVLCLMVAVSARALGNAIGHEYEDHILTTIDGKTLDCERIVDVQGRVFYDSCEEVYAP